MGRMRENWGWVAWVKLGSLEFIKNIAFVYYICFGDLDSALCHRNGEKFFFAVIGRPVKPCFKLRWPHIPSSAFECSSLNNHRYLASRSFARTGWLLPSNIDIAWQQSVKPWWLKVEAIVGWTTEKDWRKYNILKDNLVLSRVDNVNWLP